MSRKKRRGGTPATKQGKPAVASKKKRGGWRAVHWLALGGLTVLALVAWRASPASGGRAAGLPPRSGEAAPDLRVKTLDGQKLSLADLRGKVVLVNFWATWCPPCRAEMPGFERVWRERQKDGFVAIGLSEDDGAGAVAAFLQERGVSYPVAMAGASARHAFGGVNALPASFLIDKHGVVRRTVTGEFEERLLRQDVNRLLKE